MFGAQSSDECEQWSAAISTRCQVLFIYFYFCILLWLKTFCFVLHFQMLYFSLSFPFYFEIGFNVGCHQCCSDSYKVKKVFFSFVLWNEFLLFLNFLVVISQSILATHKNSAGNNVCADCGSENVDWASASVSFLFYLSKRNESNSTTTICFVFCFCSSFKAWCDVVWELCWYSS